MQRETHDNLARLRLAVEDASWLVKRGYPRAEATGFVAIHRQLSDQEQALLEKAAQGNALVKHHIARELDPEDVSRRPLRIDTASVLATVEAGIAGKLLIETEAGVLVDPDFERSTYQPGGTTALASPRAPVPSARRVGERVRSRGWLIGGSDRPAPRAVLADRRHLVPCAA